MKVYVIHSLAVCLCAIWSGDICSEQISTNSFLKCNKIVYQWTKAEASSEIHQSLAHIVNNLLILAAPESSRLKYFKFFPKQTFNYYLFPTGLSPPTPLLV